MGDRIATVIVEVQIPAGEDCNEKLAEVTGAIEGGVQSTGLTYRLETAHKRWASLLERLQELVEVGRTMARILDGLVNLQKRMTEQVAGLERRLGSLETFYRGLMADVPGAHEITVKVRRDPDGKGAWLGVGVCRQCQPGEQVRRAFTYGEPCPECGGDGELEWRWWPEI